MNYEYFIYLFKEILSSPFESVKTLLSSVVQKEVKCKLGCVYMILLFAKTTPHGVVWTTLNDEECSKKLIQNKIKHDNIIKKKYLRSTEKLKNCLPR